MGVLREIKLAVLPQSSPVEGEEGRTMASGIMLSPGILVRITSKEFETFHENRG